MITSKTTMGGLALVTSLALAGCTSTAAPPITTMPAPIDCGAQGLSGQTGRLVTGTTAADVRIDGQPVRATGDIRVIGPGQAVQLDYQPERLNLETDSTGRLVRAYCS